MNFIVSLIIITVIILILAYCLVKKGHNSIEKEIRITNDKIKVLAPTKIDTRCANLTIYLDPDHDQKLNLIIKKNQRIILRIFFEELSKNGFSLTASDVKSDGKITYEINSFKDLLDLHERLDEITINVTKNDFKANAHFMFNCGFYGIHCLDNSLSLDPFIIKTNNIRIKLSNRYGISDITSFYFYNRKYKVI